MEEKTAICEKCKEELRLEPFEIIVGKYECANCKYVGATQSDKIEFDFPNPLLGLLLYALFFVVVIVMYASNVTENIILALDYFVGIFFLGYYFYTLYRFHQILNTLDIFYPISPNKSTLGYIIPFYNLYFIFKWPNEFVRFHNRMSQVNKLTIGVGGILHLLAIIISNLLGGGLIILFGLLAYYNTTLKKLVEKRLKYFERLPFSYKEDNFTERANHSKNKQPNFTEGLENYVEIDDSELSEVERKKVYGKLFDLKGKVNKTEISQKYKELMKKYHPDNVSHLGDEFKIFAEMKTKDINKAYSYFKKKYNL